MNIHRHGTGQKLARGFTVLELMITACVAGILLLTGLPSLQQFGRQQRMKAAIGQLQNDLMMGRSEAVMRNLAAVACPGNPSSGCSGIPDWADGWIVFSDANGDRQFQAGETLLRHGQHIENMNISGSAGRHEVRFFPNGSAPGSNGSITFCGLGGPAEARKLVISNLGRIRRDTAKDTDPVKCPISA
ncbi:MAG: GspH/FimT family pseudopilin [Xanthomonadales bacterium]|jgi:type IV fimbrial biogenesis protein FimT|nr:GspH/FimT family pseudopilin [Xanthomonadales bacterium]MDH3924729.1 GspH/FimT family pseudopilin [Xanthomonadales bacterium]MDH3941715.1 GspH/FimT family pseudopilin [Xanthomonadales bacterium]MDH4003005.1 GspH/FimT family pseudopilin [Xanthomonadales bacterium]